jgi:hypothetical protein
LLFALDEPPIVTFFSRLGVREKVQPKKRFWRSSLLSQPAINTQSLKYICYFFIFLFDSYFKKKEAKLQEGTRPTQQTKESKCWEDQTGLPGKEKQINNITFTSLPNYPETGENMIRKENGIHLSTASTIKYIQQQSKQYSLKESNYIQIKFE